MSGALLETAAFSERLPPGGAGVIGYFRVAVGVHYPSDVLGGAALGSAEAHLSVAVWTRLERVSARGSKMPRIGVGRRSP